MTELDHTNRPVPDNESPETIIKVWKVSPNSGEFDHYLIRGWQEMLTFVRDHVESMLENETEDGEERIETSISVKLIDISKAEYDEVQENS